MLYAVCLGNMILSENSFLSVLFCYPSVDVYALASASPVKSGADPKLPKFVSQYLITPLPIDIVRVSIFHQ